MNVDLIAKIAHEVNRAYCQANGDNTQPAWADAPDWQKESATAGVRAHLEREMSPEDSHNEWMRHKWADGWSYGPHKDPEHKKHPCMVPYHMLPLEQRTKDFLFRAVVHCFKEQS